MPRPIKQEQVKEESRKWLEAILQDERFAMEKRHRLLLEGFPTRQLDGYVAEKGPIDVPLQSTESSSDPVLAADDGDGSQKTGDVAARASRQSVFNLHGSLQDVLGEVEETTTKSQEEARCDFSRWHPSNLVHSSHFELFFAAMILMNVVVMGIESQYHGLDAGFKLKFRSFDRSAEAAWPGADVAFMTLEVMFGSIFAVELCIKLAGLKSQFARDFWNWFDLALVLVWAAEVSLSSAPVDPSLLRLVRLVRLLRLLRLARTVSGFDSLAVMTTALSGSGEALFWVAILLLLAQMMFALLLSALLTRHVLDYTHDLDQENRQLLFSYFGTFARSMLSMFELTLGNWGPVARVLQDTVGGYFVIFSIAHKVTFGFACVGVINGVFMQETLKVAQHDDAMLMRDACRNKKTHVQKMQEFLQYVDQSGDGKISIEEWYRCLQNPKVKSWFAGQGLSLKDVDGVFDMLETDGDKNLSAEELIEGVFRLKGPARALDLAVTQDNLVATQKEMHEVLTDLCNMHQEIHSLTLAASSVRR